MSDRDTLADLIDELAWISAGLVSRAALSSRPGESTALYDLARKSDAVVRRLAGWRPPARVISEVETHHLLPGAIVRRDGKAWEREHGMWWHAGVLAPRAVPYGSGPITVLYDPAEETDQ